MSTSSSHPHDGRLLVTSRYFFADPSAEVCRQFLGLFAVEEVRAVEILPPAPWRRSTIATASSPAAPWSVRSPASLANGLAGASPFGITASGDLPLAAEGWRVERHRDRALHLGDRARATSRASASATGSSAAGSGCVAIDAALMRAFGVDRYATHPQTATVLIFHDPRTVSRHQLLRILDQALLVDAEGQDSADPADLDFALCTACSLWPP